MSFGDSFAAIVKRYGKTVWVERDGVVLGPGRALLQPMPDQERQFLPSDLGLGREERTLCLGERSLPLEPGAGEWVLRQGSDAFDILRVQAVEVGSQRVYWRLILTRRDEEAAA